MFYGSHSADSHYARIVLSRNKKSSTVVTPDAVKTALVTLVVSDAYYYDGENVNYFDTLTLKLWGDSISQFYCDTFMQWPQPRHVYDIGGHKNMKQVFIGELNKQYKQDSGPSSEPKNEKESSRTGSVDWNTTNHFTSEIVEQLFANKWIPGKGIPRQIFQAGPFEPPRVRENNYKNGPPGIEYRFFNHQQMEHSVKRISQKLEKI